MQAELFPVEIIYFDEFKKNLKKLSKKYKNIKKDIEPLIEELKNKNFLGDKVTDVSSKHTVYKARRPNSDSNKGKRSGYRIIYQVRQDGKTIELVTIFSKAEQPDISNNEIREIIKAANPED